MTTTSLGHLVKSHHRQAADIVWHTGMNRRSAPMGLYPSTVNELRRVGNRFTTRVEKRLRRMETRS